MLPRRHGDDDDDDGSEELLPKQKQEMQTKAEKRFVSWLKQKSNNNNKIAHKN